MQAGMSKLAKLKRNQQCRSPLSAAECGFSVQVKRILQMLSMFLVAMVYVACGGSQGLEKGPR